MPPSSRLFTVAALTLLALSFKTRPQHWSSSENNESPISFRGLVASASSIAESSASNEGSNDDDAASSPGDNGQAQLPNDLSSPTPTTPSPALDEASVVLITGAAGFIGSELALALRRTYGVRKLLLVDNLGIDSESEAQYVPPMPGAPVSDGNEAIYTKFSEDGLSLFEFKRQRAFRVFHELTAPLMVTSTHNNADGRNIDEAESIRFYRSDMRPSIPEFFDFGEVPLLEGIFQSHPDITHVVHLADVPQNVNQAIPRNKDSIKAGRMEGVLEEFRMILERRKAQDAAMADGSGSDNELHLPHFVYASSSEVYDIIAAAENQQQPNPPPFREDKPITTPSSLRGASKLIDEVLASAYHSTHGIYSVGLRFFSVYGPWATPGTEVFELVERVTAENDDDPNSNAPEADLSYYGDTKDYVYIDDAVDAIMAAMQYRPAGADPPPVVFNVGSGKGSTLKELRDLMVGHFPKPSDATARRTSNSDIHPKRIPTTSIASTSRSEAHLGFKAQVSLSEGLAHTLTWHRDRSFPYGRDPSSHESFHQQGIDSAIVNSLESARGEAGRCSPLDRECLRGAPVFPCASECKRSERCTPSAWDDAAVLSKMVTTGCDAVLYTILLDDEAEQIPSATTAIGTDSMPYVGAGLPADIGAKTQVRCNIAFVSESSPLVHRLKSEGEEYLEEDGSGLPPLLRHGFWTVLPVKTPSADSKSWLHAFAGAFALEYLPKVSPGRFFGSSVRYAVYADANMIIDNLPKLLKKMEDGPSVKNGSTALMLSEKHQLCDPNQRGSNCSWSSASKNDSIQTGVYNMIRVALRGEILGGGLNPVVDSSFVIHSLREEDARLFRCDAYSEAAQWGATSDERALEFIISLHDLWSRAVTHWSGESPWWSASAASNEEGAASEENRDDATGSNDDEQGSRRKLLESNDVKSRGTFFGILSSTEVQLFIQIVPADALGAVILDGYHRQ